MSVHKEDEKLECVSDLEREAAHQAFCEFQQTNYSACLQNLQKLDNKKDDFKVIHNKYIAEYYKSDCKKTSAFFKNLTHLLNQFGLHIDRLDDVEYCVAYFNIGVLLFQERQYSKTLKIIERIYKFIEPLDETLGQHVGLLLVELHICVRQVEKALSLITYFHNQASLTLKDKDGKQAKSKSDKEVKMHASDGFLKSLEMYRIRCNLLMHSLKAASADIKVLHEENGKNIEVLYLLANEQYLEGNFMAAMQTLGKVPANALSYLTSGENSNAMFYNNVGVIHHAMGKPNLACHYYNQALREEQQLAKLIGDDCPLYAMGASKHHEIMFNMGISLLSAGKSSQAFDCLIVAVRKYHRNCRLWLRLAECCIQLHKPTNTVDFDIHQKQKELVVDVLGSTETQKVILNTNLTKDKKYSDSQSYAVPVATLEFATLCLKNAEFVLESDASSSSEPLLLIPGVSLPTSTTNSISLPSSPIQPDDKIHLKNSILAASAYVSLCLGDYVVALGKATELLQQPKTSGAHKLLGHLYAVECLVLQDKLNEALEHLNPELIKDIGLECPSEEPVEDEIPTQTSPPTMWFPNRLPSAIAVMQYNVAVIKTIKGQYDQAGKLLNQVWQSHGPDSKVPAQIIMLVLYIKIQSGHVEVAKNFIRQYSIQRRISG